MNTFRKGVIFMKKVTAILALMFLVSTGISTFAEDSTGSSFRAWDWSAIGVNPVGGGTSRSKYFTSSSTWTVPNNVSLIWVTAWGGGGGGGGGQNNNGWGICSGGGGGSSAFVSAFPLAVTAGGTVTITIGAGGPGGPANGNGSYGGATTVSGSGYSVSVPGGQGGCGYSSCGGGYPYTNCSGGNGGSPNYWTGGAMTGITGNNGLLSSMGTQGGTGGAGYNGPGGAGSTTGNGVAAAANTGAGGGGAKYNALFEGYVGGPGGSGGVILAWIQ